MNKLQAGRCFTMAAFLRTLRDYQFDMMSYGRRYEYDDGCGCVIGYSNFVFPRSWKGNRLRKGTEGPLGSSMVFYGVDCSLFYPSSEFTLPNAMADELEHQCDKAGWEIKIKDRG